MTYRDVSLSGEGLAVLMEPVLPSLDERARPDWARLLAAQAGRMVSGRVTDKAWLLGNYRMRLNTAERVGLPAPEGLTAVVETMDAAPESEVVFLLFAWGAHGYLIWLAPDLSRVVAVWRARDRRVPDAA
ncbi:hypothetical protein [Dactylosporangium sp. CA-233914]|uniref:hypothetical protein n=1 Tax=Dactylosporangium sp. CA-233914 TaxID=3239934 RepID=UPI003D930986